MIGSKATSVTELRYVTINNERSEIQTIKYGAPQGSMFDLSDLVQWLWSNNKIALNVNKTSTVIFWSPRKYITKK